MAREATPMVGGEMGEDLLERLRSLQDAPPMYEPGVSFWDDPHISKGLLDAHLDPEQEVASRPPEIIQRTVDWIISRCHLKVGSGVLDLGCGPGLYCQLLAEAGMRVTGIDVSPKSLDYARGRAESSGLSIEYIQGDYTRVEIEDEFDAVLMIFGDLCALSPWDRDIVLRKVRRWLKPGARFVFDVVTSTRFSSIADCNRWYVSQDSFWSPGTYLVLENSFNYPEEQLRLEQYAVMSEDLSMKIFRFWHKHYGLGELSGVLREADLEVENVYGDLTGTPFSIEDHWMGVVSRISSRSYSDGEVH